MRRATLHLSALLWLRAEVAALQRAAAGDGDGYRRRGWLKTAAMDAARARWNLRAARQAR